MTGAISKTRTALRWLSLLAAGCTVLSCSVLGCTALVLDTAEQCEATADCVALGPEFASHTCNADKICVPATDPTCTTAQECIEANNGAPSACIQGSCVQLTTEHCQTIVPESAIDDDNAIIIGWMGPLVGEFAGLGLPIERGAELALREINANSNGLPGIDGGPRRPLLMVACHDLADTEAVTAHLLDNVQVPAILGPAFSGVTVQVATDVAIPNGTLLLSGSATSPQITSLDDNDLVWRTVPSDAIQTIPLADLVMQLEAHIRTEQNLTPADNIRIATTVKEDAYGFGLADALNPILMFNGVSAAENGNNFLPSLYPDPSGVENPDYSTLISNIVTFAPHIVIPLGTSEGVNDIMVGIEQAWPTTGTPPPRPYYLVPDGGRLPALLTLVTDNEDLRLRIKGTVPGRKIDNSNYASFALRYRMAFDNEEPGTFADNAYDAAYLMAYSIVMLGNEPITGSGLAQSLMRMSDNAAGTVVVSGPTDINKAYTALTTSTDATLDFDGTSGPLDFDNTTGEAESDIDVWCIEIDQVTMEPVFISSGQYYDAETEMMQGTDMCEAW